MAASPSRTVMDDSSFGWGSATVWSKNPVRGRGSRLPLLKFSTILCFYCTMKVQEVKPEGRRLIGFFM
ncbi:hypothetical protein SELSPUOL_01298 [Selenomonas sputigena ATCC 35185]|uniref:Uncharacterized protein n=1 Tax=Selenomonas sputigena (strain ATCC 35185 / DSM 20758 / CCUG 44933 / VPI D19B-28) TaxID=546271 RepID=C9LV07_SELS3|nr:hypothetical protein SELSPUOL_01298 [Selenomonas sputigena ATCC 35185]